jgi:glutamate/tyrosine decarboxylase-like PLP-dependent enzyme
MQEKAAPNSAMQALILPAEATKLLWKTLEEILESYRETLDELRVSPVLDVRKVRGFAESFTFEHPRAPEELLSLIASQLIENQVHTSSSRYFGLFNPAPTTMSIFADALTAGLNPQLAAWTHSPLAAEMEQHLVRSLGAKFGFHGTECDGTFTSGGAEANQTAVFAALAWQWPEAISSGVRALPQDPVLYVSDEGHDSFLKAARVCGLGDASFRRVGVGSDLRIDVEQLRRQLQNDRSAGRAPFMIVGTAGTTGAGVVDPLAELAAVACDENIWFHVDAAWGGAAMLVPELRDVLYGIERADSITFDPHKWLSTSMGAGMFITRHPGILARIFSLPAGYMPKEGELLQVTDPFAHSLQWSRRFTGLKLFLSLAVAGWDGYSAAIRHQAHMGDVLRSMLRSHDWQIENNTRLPVVCFSDASWPRDSDAHQSVCNAVVASGAAWISTVRLGAQKRPALRACITNCQTKESDLDRLLAALRQARLKNSEAKSVMAPARTS